MPIPVNVVAFERFLQRQNDRYDRSIQGKRLAMAH